MREAGVRFMVGTMKRYDPAYERLLEYLPLEDLRLVSVTTLESPFQPYVQAYPLTPMTPPAPDVLAALKDDDAKRLLAALPEGDDDARFCYRWMLLDNLVHELNMLRGALGEPDVVHHARLGRTVCEISLGFGRTEVHMSWVDLPGHGALQATTRVLRPRQARHPDTPLAVPTRDAEPVDDRGWRRRLPHSWRTNETLSYEEAFKRELVEFESAIRSGRDPRTNIIDGLHDIALCHAIATSHITGQPVTMPSALPAWAN